MNFNIKIILVLLSFFTLCNKSFAAEFIKEVEPNDTLLTKQKITLPLEVEGEAFQNDSGEVFLVTDSGLKINIQDLYSINLKEETEISINLKIENESADLDLVLLNKFANKVLDYSTSLKSRNERITILLKPGEYLIGVSAYSGNSKYILKLKKTGLSLDSVPSGNMDEVEPNEYISDAQEIKLTTYVQGDLNKSDLGQIVLTTKNGEDLVVQDLYKLFVGEPKNVLLNLKVLDKNANLSFVVLSNDGKKIITFLGKKKEKNIIKKLDAGNYLIGVFTFDVGADYLLEVSEQNLENDNNEKLEIISDDVFYIPRIFGAYKLNLEIASEGFEGVSVCRIFSENDSNLVFKPNRFKLSSRKNIKRSKLIVPFSKVVQINTLNKPKAVNVRVNCSNGVRVNKNIFIAPSGEFK